MLQHSNQRLSKRQSATLARLSNLIRRSSISVTHTPQPPIFYRTNVHPGNPRFFTRHRSKQITLTHAATLHAESPSANKQRTSPHKSNSRPVRRRLGRGRAPTPQVNKRLRDTTPPRAERRRGHLRGGGRTRILRQLGHILSQKHKKKGNLAVRLVP